MATPKLLALIESLNILQEISDCNECWCGVFDELDICKHHLELLQRILRENWRL